MGAGNDISKATSAVGLTATPVTSRGPLERVGPAIHPIGQRIKFEKTDICLVYRDSLAKEPNQVARLMYDNLNLHIAKGFSDQLVEYIKKDAAQYGKGDMIDVPDRNMQVILGTSLT